MGVGVVWWGQCHAVTRNSLNSETDFCLPSDNNTEHPASWLFLHKKISKKSKSKFKLLICRQCQYWWGLSPYIRKHTRFAHSSLSMSRRRSMTSIPSWEPVFHVKSALGIHVQEGIWILDSPSIRLIMDSKQPNKISTIRQSDALYKIPTNRYMLSGLKEQRGDKMAAIFQMTYQNWISFMKLIVFRL